MHEYSDILCIFLFLKMTSNLLHSLQPVLGCFNQIAGELNEEQKMEYWGKIILFFSTNGAIVVNSVSLLSNINSLL